MIRKWFNTNTDINNTWVAHGISRTYESFCSSKFKLKLKAQEQLKKLPFFPKHLSFSFFQKSACEKKWGKPLHCFTAIKCYNRCKTDAFFQEFYLPFLRRIFSFSLRRFSIFFFQNISFSCIQNVSPFIFQRISPFPFPRIWFFYFQKISPFFFWRISFFVFVFFQKK